MMSRIYFNAFFLILCCVPFRVLSHNEHEAEPSTQRQDASFTRTSQHSTTLNPNMQKTLTSLYSNHQTHYTYPIPQNQNQNNKISKRLNNYESDNKKKLIYNNYPNHRTEEYVTVPQRKLQITSNNNKEITKEKFVLNIDEDDEDYKPTHHFANKQKNMRKILTNLLKRTEHNANFAAVLPILKVMSPAQRVAMASLVTNQISNEGRNSGLKLAQVKSMFGNNSNATSDLMLPIILDIANLFKTLKDKKNVETLPQPAQLRRSFSDVSEINFSDLSQPLNYNQGRSIRRMDVIDEEDDDRSDIGVISNSTKANKIIETNTKLEYNKNNVKNSLGSETSKLNGTLDETGNSTAEDLPVAEELRYVSKLRNGNYPMPRPLMVRRPGLPGQHLPPSYPNRRISIEQRRRQAIIAEQQRAGSADPMKCNFFTDTLCLDVSDYPMHAITASIRKNLNVMNALHSDFPEISAETALDGISKKQEDKYTPEHYLNNINRREDGEIAPADASGFMCPSVVKYARPQKARATSGQWKYIVNTGEHTQTLRLEKCLKPKESCTFLTDNFKSKCVQVYNYHRLLTWDQQNGLHMDIFKVPTCCSCHIEGYSFAFPPHSSKPPEETSENFPGEEIIHESGKNRYVYASTPVRQSSVSKETILNAFKNGNSEEYSSLSNLHHYNFPKNSPSAHQFPSPNNNFYEDIYQTQDTNIHIRNVKKPVRETDSELSSFLEPPSKPNLPLPKVKPAGNVYIKRGQVGNQANILKRPVRKPIRKKISEIEDQDLGASNNYETQSKLNPELQPSNSHTKVPLVIRSSTDAPTLEKTSTLQTSTTERHFTKVTSSERGNGVLKDISLNRRVNYNYHPIIDFFGERNNEKTEPVASDRIDSITEYHNNEESDWRPMAGPVSSPLKPPPLVTNNNG